MNTYKFQIFELSNGRWMIEITYRSNARETLEFNYYTDILSYLTKFEGNI